MSKVSKITPIELKLMIDTATHIEAHPTELFGDWFYIGDPEYTGQSKIIYESGRLNECYEGVAKNREDAESIARYAVGIDGGYHIAVIVPDSSPEIDFERWDDFISF